MTDSPLLLPADPAWSVVFMLMWGLILLLAVVAVISVAKVMRTNASSTPVLWLLLVFLVPVLGPIFWFAFGRASVLRADASPRQQEL